MQLNHDELSKQQPEPSAQNEGVPPKLEEQIISEQNNLHGLRVGPIQGLIVTSISLGIMVVLYGGRAFSLGQLGGPIYLVIGLLLVGFNWIAWQLYQAKKIEHAAMLTLASLILVSNIALFLPNAWQLFVPYISIPIIVASGLLIIPEIPFGVALIAVCTNLMTIITLMGFNWEVLSYFIVPTVFSLATALTVWVSISNLLSSFHWAVQSQDKTRHRGDELFASQQIIKKTNELLEAQTIELRQARDATQAALIEAEEARAKADSANQAKSEFLSAMSHELRTPLNGILGYAQILRRRHDLNADMINGLNIIYQSGSHLLTLINDILDLSKVEARKMELHPEAVNLPAFLESVVGIIYMRAREKGLEFKQEFNSLPLVVMMDEKRLRQILLNLLGNAVKFTAHGAVTLRVSQMVVQPLPPSVSPDSGGMKGGYSLIRFEVEDSGVGIAAQDIEKIFQPFEQTGNIKQRAEGTGLGLAISCQLVELMGGTIQVKSELEQGSLFWFELALPLGVTNDTLLRPKTISRQVVGYQGVRQRLLVVDDASSNRYLLRALLEPLGFEISEAENGAVAFDLTLQFRPDLIITDLIMPETSGFEFIEKIYAMPDLVTTHIIVVSASSFAVGYNMELIRECDGYLSKPIDVNKLLELMGQALNLEWLYETEAITEAIESIVSLPQAELMELHQYVKDGYMREIRLKAEVLLTELGAEYHPFIHQVLTLARGYEEEKLRALLEQYL